MFAVPRESREFTGGRAPASQLGRSCTGRSAMWVWRVMILALTLALSGCAPEFHESVGPTVPVPNLFGRVLRAGDGAADLSLSLEDSAEAEQASARTDRRGAYRFDQVPAGVWALRIDSEEATDFARLTYEFVLEDPEVGLTLPDFEIGLGTFEIEDPDPGADEDLPGFFSPLEFRWKGLEGELQVRLYRDADGAPVWFSASTGADFVRWNGLGNQGEFRNVAVPAGDYRWRVRIDRGGSLRTYTAYQDLTLEE